jgi:hypothetical protein
VKTSGAIRPSFLAKMSQYISSEAFRRTSGMPSAIAVSFWEFPLSNQFAGFRGVEYIFFIYFPPRLCFGFVQVGTFIAIGTTRGFVALFDFHQTFKVTLGDVNRKSLLSLLFVIESP